MRRVMRRNLQPAGLAIRIMLAAAVPAVGLAPSHAQEAFFHRGAQFFLGGSNQLAKAEVERGLQAHPNDEALKKFWELLNQQQQNSDEQKDQDKKDQEQKDQQDQQKKDQKGQKDQDKQDKQDSSKPSQDPQKQDQKDQQKGQKPEDQPKDPKDQQKQPSGGKKDQDKKDGEDAKAAQSQKDPGQEGNPDGEVQPAKMIRMTPQQAVQLLETLKNDERTLQFKPILRTNRTEQLRKNW